MKFCKLWSVLLLSMPWVALAKVEVSLLEQPSTLVVARSSGVVSEKIVDVNELVIEGSALIMLYNNNDTSVITANSDGLLQAYAEAVKKGTLIQKGDVVAVLSSDDIKGILVLDEKDIERLPLKAEKSYCCLQAGHYEFEIDILRMKFEHKRTLYYFSVEDESGLLRLLQNQNREGKQDVSFRYVPVVE